MIVVIALSYSENSGQTPRQRNVGTGLALPQRGAEPLLMDGIRVRVQQTDGH